jgi:hypothetical protein
LGGRKRRLATEEALRPSKKFLVPKTTIEALMWLKDLICMWPLAFTERVYWR